MPLQTLQLTFFFSLGLVLSKLQGKVVTNSQDFVWWSFLMVECVSILGANWTYNITHSTMRKLHHTIS